MPARRGTGGRPRPLREVEEHLENGHRLAEPLEGRGASGIETEMALAHTEVADDRRDGDAVGGGHVAQPGRQLDGRPEQVAVLGHGLTGADADADMDGLLGVDVSAPEAALDVDGRLDGRQDRANDAMMPSPVCFTSRPARVLQGRRARSRRARG